MAAAALSTGEERLDLLIRMVPVIYPGSELIVDGLSVLTAVMINDTQCCSRIGVADVVKYKLEEIRSVRQSREDIDDVDVSVMYDFYYDVMRCYAGAERRRLTETEFAKMATFDPMTSLKGVIDGQFGKIHDALATLGMFFLPSSWGRSGSTQFRVEHENEVKRRLSYCYIRLFRLNVQLFVASVLGPRPTLGAVLSLLSESVSRPREELEEMFVIRCDNNDLHLTRKTPVGVHLLAEDLMLFRDDEDGRSSGLLSIFDRVGASPADASHDSMFERAAKCLADLAQNVEGGENSEAGSYKLANVDFDQPAEVVDFPEGAQSLRTMFNNDYLPSFVKAWRPETREAALALALKEYNDRVLNLHVASVGLTQLQEKGRLKQCSSNWRGEVAELVSLSKTDADYWYEIVELLASEFRKIFDSTLPAWLLSTFERKSDEFFKAALMSYEKPYKPPAESFCGFANPIGDKSRHSRSVSGSSKNSFSSASGRSDSSEPSSLSSSSSSGKAKLPPECRERFRFLMACPEHKIPGFVANLPFGHRFKLAGGECYQRYKTKYVKGLVLKEFNSSKYYS